MCMKSRTIPVNNRCECGLCQRNEQVRHFVATLPVRKRKFVERLYDALFEAEAEIEMLKAWYEK